MKYIYFNYIFYDIVNVFLYSLHNFSLFKNTYLKKFILNKKEKIIFKNKLIIYCLKKKLEYQRILNVFENYS